MSMAVTCLMLLTLALSASLIIPLVYGADNDSDKQALVAFKKSLTDPDNALQNWDGSGNPCNWTNIYCKNNRVTSVMLGHTNLGGHLVPELGGLSALEYLSVFNNEIEGTIPAEIGNLENLQVLGLSENKLSGGIPPSLGNLKSLYLLLLDSNRLTGEVPSEIANLPNLNLANFSNNVDLCWNFWPTPKFVGPATWCPPPMGWLKLNCDGSVSSNQEQVGGGAIIRNADGGFIGAVSQRFTLKLDPLACELFAIKIGLEFVLVQGWQHVLVETDCLEEVNVVNGGEECYAAVGVILDSIRRLMARLNISMIIHTPRVANMAAHAIAKFVALENGRMIWLRDGPSWLVNVMNTDILVTMIPNRR